MLDWNNLDVDSVRRSLDNYKQTNGFKYVGLFCQHPKAGRDGYIFDSNVDEDVFETFYHVPPYCYSNSLITWLLKKHKKAEEKRKKFFTHWKKVHFESLPEELKLKDPCKRLMFVVAIV